MSVKPLLLITGAGGMLGQALQLELESDFRLVALNRSELDVKDLDSLRRICSEIRPDWILHAAAFTAVDRAEKEAEQARRTNVLGSRNVALAAEQIQGTVLYFSTDYVFDGCKETPYLEWDRTNPLNEYGRTKLAGEQLVQTLCPRHLIVRTSWLFGAGGPNFVTRILERARQSGVLRVVNDQIGSPTYTRDLAHAVRSLVAENQRGLYHLTNSGSCSWFELARETVELAGFEIAIEAQSSESLAAPARRPKFSVLDNSLWRQEGRTELRNWKTALAEFMSAFGTQPLGSSDKKRSKLY